MNVKMKNVTNIFNRAAGDGHVCGNACALAIVGEEQVLQHRLRLRVRELVQLKRYAAFNVKASGRLP